MVLYALLILLALLPTASALEQEELRAVAVEVFRAISEAERAGGDVSELVLRLNEAIRLIDSEKEVDLAQAKVLLEQVRAQTSLVQAAGVQQTTKSYLDIGATLVVLGVVGVLVWVYGSQVFLRLWVRRRVGWRVERP